MKIIKLQSPAKVNLHLRIIGRRRNGYHNLITLFHRISLCDTLTLTKSVSDFSFSSNAPLPKREGNLLFKAYAELVKSFPRLGGVRVKLIKRIPIGAGLGGGSGNAASFLIGMKKLYGLRVSAAALRKIGGRVGADVPFFMMGKTQAAAAGIGDKLHAVSSRRKLWFLLVPSKEPLSTPLVYKTFAAAKPARFSTAKAESEVRKVAAAWNSGIDADAGQSQRNDLEAAAFQLRPDILKTIQLLREYTDLPVMMSGSGPTVFAVSSRRPALFSLKKKLPAKLKKNAILCSSY